MKTDAEYNAFLNACLQDLFAANKRAVEQWSFGSYERWDVSQTTGEFTFSDAGIVKVIAEPIFVGSFSFVSNTWKWGWDNSSIDERLTRALIPIREYGESHGIPDFVRPMWPGEEQDAWAMAAVALRIIGGQAVYRGPSGQGATWFLLRNVRRVQ